MSEFKLKDNESEAILCSIYAHVASENSCTTKIEISNETNGNDTENQTMQSFIKLPSKLICEAYSDRGDRERQTNYSMRICIRNLKATGTHK